MATATTNSTLNVELEAFDLFLDELETEAEANLEAANSLNTTANSPAIPWAVLAMGAGLGAAVLAIAGWML